MSIYATLWSLRFPRYGDDYVGCEWIGVAAQGAPAHIGTPTQGFGYHTRRVIRMLAFCPLQSKVKAEGDGEFMRAVVIITKENQKGTSLHLKSTEPFAGSFRPRLCLDLVARAHLRRFAGNGSKVVAQSFTAGGDIQLYTV